VPADQKPVVLRMLLDDMINERLMNKACAGVKVDPAAVDAEFAKILKARGASEEDAKKELAQMGMTIEKVKADISQRMQQRQWVDEQIKGKAADATDAEAKEFYEKNPQHFDQPDQVRASHILFRVEPDATPEKVTATLKKAEGATARAKKEDFAKLAGELSEEPGAAERGGDLNFFPRKGAMVEPFAEAAFKLQKGEVSPEPVRTEFGYHVIKVTDKKAGGKQPFDDAKPQIVAFLSRERKRVAIDEVIAGMRQKADVKLNIAAPAAPATPATATTPPISVPPKK
jgi:peptidyl-prolyl cis-trans isomerase C